MRDGYGETLGRRVDCGEEEWKRVKGHIGCEVVEHMLQMIDDIASLFFERVQHGHQDTSCVCASI